MQSYLMRRSGRVCANGYYIYAVASLVIPQHYLCRMDVYFTLNELGGAAVQLLQRAGGRNVIAFHGEMGSGKTTFIHALCDALEVEDAVSSPTFPIINEYESSRGRIFHIDL